MSEYNQIIYVSQSKGNDNNDGSSLNNAVKNIKRAVELVKNNNTLINIDEGTYEVYQLIDMSHATYKITYMGQNIKTILKIQYTNYSQFKNKVNFIGLIIKPSDNFSGDTRVLIYTVDNYEVQFHNILFLKSDNHRFPTSQDYFYFHNNSISFPCNKKFFNCTFNINKYTARYGFTIYENCVTNHNKFTNTATLNNSYTNAILDDYYNVVDKELLNKKVGVYYGEYGWEISKYLLKDKKGTFSYDNSDRIYLESITTDKLKERGLDSLNDVIRFHKEFNDETLIKYKIR